MLDHDAELAAVSFLVPEFGMRLDAAGLPALRVVQTLSAGTDWLDGWLPDGVLLCNARGARDAAVAEWVLGALLGASTGLLRAAADRSWRPSAPTEVAGSEVLILGAGSIARAVAARLAPFGASVTQVGRRARPGVLDLEEGLDRLPGADAVVSLLPLTAATRGLVDEAALARMRDGALLVNAGRGATVDTDALTRELRTGRLRAVLDVVEPEPLPASHPLWSAPGLLALTSHHAGDSAAADRRAVLLAAEQLRRFVDGQPLQNVVAGSA